MSNYQSVKIGQIQTSLFRISTKKSVLNYYKKTDICIKFKRKLKFKHQKQEKSSKVRLTDFVILHYETHVKVVTNINICINFQEDRTMNAITTVRNLVLNNCTVYRTISKNSSNTKEFFMFKGYKIALKCCLYLFSLYSVGKPNILEIKVI